MSLKVGAAQDGSRNIQGTAESAVYKFVRFDRGIVPNERHANQAAVMQGAFQNQLVIAHEIAVIAREDDDGVFIEPKHFQPTQDTTDGIIDHRDHAVGKCNRLTRLALGHSECALAIFVRTFLGSFLVKGLQMRRDRPLRGVKRSWQRNRCWIVHIPIAARRRKWMMRVGK
jgi:hypothetical protein